MCNYNLGDEHRYSRQCLRVRVDLVICAFDSFHKFCWRLIREQCGLMIAICLQMNAHFRMILIAMIWLLCMLMQSIPFVVAVVADREDIGRRFRGRGMEIRCRWYVYLSRCP